MILEASQHKSWNEQEGSCRKPLVKPRRGMHAPLLFFDEFWDLLCGHFVIFPWLTLCLVALTFSLPSGLRGGFGPHCKAEGAGEWRGIWPAAESSYFLDSWMTSSKPTRCWSVCTSALKSEPVSAVATEPSPELGLSFTVPWAQEWIPSCSVFSTASYRWKLPWMPEGSEEE